MATAESISAASPAIPKTGDIVAEKYRIESMIAEGGMGRVYEATHLQLEEKVAIKFLRTELTGLKSEDFVERFVREARTSAKIRSEHVVCVHDVGSTESGAPFIVMEFLAGKDLDQVVTDQGVLQIPQAVDYVLQACEALAEAHSLGVVHRDLKPANLFLTHRADGSPCVKVLDFGISKLTDVVGTPNMGMTKTHALMGSPQYMSPEQMRSSKNVDARADIWAIGILLHELLAGTVPFDGDSMPEICAAVLEQTPKNIRVLRPEITTELGAIVSKCLAKKPDERFQNVADLAHALGSFGSSEARTSAERIARILAVSGSGVRTGATLRDFPVDVSVFAPSESGPVLMQRNAQEPFGALDSGCMPIAWTGIEVLNPIRRRRRTIFAMSIVLAMLIGAGVVISYEAQRRAAELDARATLQPAATTQAPPVEVTEIDLVKPAASAVTISVPPPTTNVGSSDSSLQAIASQTTTTSAKIATAKHASSHAASHEHPANPVATESAETQPGDMWDQRK